MTPRLEPTTADSFAALRRLFDDPALHGWGGDGRRSDEQIRSKYLGSRAPEVEMFLVRVDGDVTGLAHLHPADHEPSDGALDLILLPAARGRGIGRQVVELLIAHGARTRGWTTFWVDPDLDNAAGIAFWDRAGFTHVRDVLDEDGRGPFALMQRSG